MKILYYSAHPGLALESESGFGTHMREVMRAFIGHGHDVRPLIMGGTVDTFDSSASPTLSRRLTDLAKRATPRAVWETAKDIQILRMDRSFERALESAMHEFEPDFVFERLNFLQLSGLSVAKRLGIPHIYEVNTPYVDVRKEPFLLKRMADRIEHEQLVGTDLAFFVSEALKEFLLDKHDLAGRKYHSVSTGVNPGFARFSDEEAASIRDRYNLDGRFILGFVGALFEWHGLEMLVSVASELIRDGRPVAVMIVGDGSAAPNLKRLVAEQGIEDWVVFTGRIPHEEVFNYIHVMDIALQANAEWYQSPTKLFEYGAMGKAVIAPDIEPVRACVEHGKDVLLTRPDPAELKRSILHLMDNEDVREALGERIRNIVNERFTWDRIAAFMLDRMAEILKSSSHSPARPHHMA